MYVLSLLLFTFTLSSVIKSLPDENKWERIPILILVSLLAIEWQIGCGDLVFPTVIGFLEWRPCVDEKQSEKLPADALNA